MVTRSSSQSLSVKLLGFTLLFGLVAQILIFFPSIASFRLDWLKDRLAAAQTAALVFEASPDNAVNADVTQRLLRYVGAQSISLKKGNIRELLASWDSIPPVDVSYDLRTESFPESLGAAISSLLSSRSRTLLVIGPAPLGSQYVELVLPEEDLTRAIRAYSLRALAFSLFISGVTAGLLYLILSVFFVRPLQALSANMTTFREHPEDPVNVIHPTGRADEIGEAEQSLREMQKDLQAALKQKTHLAALGLAVAKISHDLRNILTPVQLFADRLATLPDPNIQRTMPKIMSALDRAISLCQNTLAYGQASEPAPQRTSVELHKLIDDMAAILDFKTVIFENAVPIDLLVNVDPDQIYRILLNLTRNSLQAFARNRDMPRANDERIRIAARRATHATLIEVSDTGPGVPPTVQKKLFQPFAVTKDTGGSGLGLAITAELVKGHGGSIQLVESAEGAHFLIRLPDLPAQKA
jgi:signal transduction histidine kinase